jgi:hypothetical protein
MTIIPIERLTAGHEVRIPGFGPAEVYEVEWDRDAYHVRYDAGWGSFDHIRIPAGGALEYAYPEGEPRYWRSRAEMSEDEIKALADALGQSNTHAIVAAE